MAELWDRVEELVDRAPGVDALRAHRVHLLAARVWREAGLPVPTGVVADEHRAAMMALATPLVLRRVREAYDGPMILMKGPEAAASYRHPSDRVFRDLDLLVADPPNAQRALIAAGFIEGGDPARHVGAQHLQPLAWPGLPLVVELHRRPSHPPWLLTPPAGELFRLTVPSATRIDGVMAPVPAVHGLLLAGHAWSHHPLGRLADMIDVTAVLGPDDYGLAGDLARAWGWEGIWRTTIDAADALLAGGRTPLSLRTWARHLQRARDCSVIEDHFSRIAAPAVSVPLRRLPTAVAAAVARTGARRSDEQWSDKLRRSGLAVTHAFMDHSAHERTLTKTRKGYQ